MVVFAASSRGLRAAPNDAAFHHRRRRFPSRAGEAWLCGNTLLRGACVCADWVQAVGERGRCHIDHVRGLGLGLGVGEAGGCALGGD